MKPAWVYDVTKQTIITDHARDCELLLVEIFERDLGMREGVGGKQGGMGRDTIRASK